MPIKRRKPIQTTSLSFFRFETLSDRLWAFSQMGLARFALARQKDIGFWKLMGTGIGEGFTPIPNVSVYAILATWPGVTQAYRNTTEAPVYKRYREQARESWTVFLQATSVRGQWSHTTPFDGDADPARGPLAALTRATIRPRKLLRFWQRAPAISDAIGSDPNVIFKAGLGEVPWLHQCTFSIWPDTATMASFARRDGPHAKAIRAVREGDWFREELYARFRIVGDKGTWDGKSPLAEFRNTRTSDKDPTLTPEDFALTKNLRSARRSYRSGIPEEAGTGAG